MVNSVKKRDGRVEAFDSTRIFTAVSNAMKSVGVAIDENLINDIITKISESPKARMSVEDIQDFIEKYLMEQHQYDTVRSFILYREKHKELRSILEKEEFMNYYIASSNAATGAKYDANANVTEKNISTLCGELPKLDYLRLNRKRVTEKLRELYPNFNAKQYEKDLTKHIIYKHDETGPAVYPYCCAVTMYPYLLRGLQDIGGLSAAPKNLDSFCGMFLHLVFALASQFAGAIAFGEFFNCFDYYARKEWGDHYYKHDQKPAHIKYVKDETGNYVTKEVSISKQIEQYFQQIVYGLNQPAGNRGYQSPFTNVSYYDKNYWEALFADFYFPDGTKPQWESVSYLQKKFMKWFNKERTKCVLTFPVETMALLSDGKDKVLDEEYADFTAEMYAEGHSFFTYISNNPNGLSSCCFTGDVEPVYQIETDKDYEMGLNFAEIARLYPDSKFKIFQQNPITCDGEWKYAKLVQSAVNQIVKITLEDIPEPITCTLDHIFPTKKRGDVKAGHLEVGDKLVFNRSKMTNTIADGTLTYKKITNIETIHSTELIPVYCFEFEDEIMPYFLLENGLITHNCRLRNEIDENEFSFTNGLTGVATGSKSVITLNLNRITQDANKKWYKDLKNDKIPAGQTFCNDENCYLKQYLVNILDRVYKYHTAYNELLKDLQAKKMLPVYDAGFISLKQQFLTIGINGMNEAAEFLGFECSDNKDYENFINLICSTISEQNVLHKTDELKFNQEYVPAENLGVKNYRWDKEDGYKVPKDRNAYNSYFYLPDNPNTEVLEKFRLQGERYTKNLDGGVALHCNLDEHLSKEQYSYLIKYAIKQGCTYFCFNVKNTYCANCGYISKHTLDKCPKCGSTNLDYLTRIIGYLKKISGFSASRQLEASRRVYSKFDLSD